VKTDDPRKIHCGIPQVLTLDCGFPQAIELLKTKTGA